MVISHIAIETNISKSVGIDMGRYPIDMVMNTGRYPVARRICLLSMVDMLWDTYALAHSH